MTAPHGEGLPKTARLRRRREFLAFGRVGRKRPAAHFIVITRRNEGASRLGITVSRKIGDAVVRNRLKRHVREIFRRHPERLLAGHDLVIIARAGAADLAFDEIARELHMATRPTPSNRQRS
jgi:ribonuclease P protein component